MYRSLQAWPIIRCDIQHLLIIESSVFYCRLIDNKMNSFKNDCLALFQNAICKVTKAKCGQVEWKYNGAEDGNTQVNYK